MVESADSRQRDDVRIVGRPVLDGAAERAVFVVRAMTAVSVVVSRVIAKQKPEMPFTEYNNVIQQLASDRTNPSFGNAVGQRKQLPPYRTIRRDVSRLPTPFIRWQAGSLSW